jgi:hypothetical protein
VVKRIRHIILLLVIFTPGHAQRDISVDVEAWANVRLATLQSGWDAGRNGGGFSVGVQTSLKSHFRAIASGELGAAGVGNYLAVKGGINRPLALGSSRWTFSPGLNLIQGMALSRPNPLYMWGIEQANAFDLRFKNASGPGLLVGFRMYGFPGYVPYSKVRSYFDLRAGVRYTF